MNRLAGLDALRGLAALGVLVWHYGGHFNAMPWFDALRPFYVAGLYLVDVFFVLSGFLLGQLYKSGDLLPEFFFKRVTRLFPLHWVTLLVTAFLQALYVAQAGVPFIYAINDGFHFGLNLLLLQQSGLQQGFSFNGPSWSISAEWLVNLMFMALLFAPVRRYPLAAGITIAAFLCLSLGQGRLIGSGALAGWLDFGLLRGAFGFFLGVWLADLLSPPGKLHALCGRFGALTGRLWDVFGLLAGGVLLVFMARPDWQRVPGVDFVVIGGCVPLLVVACSRGFWLTRLCRWHPLLWLGDVSFSVYLWHFPLQIAFVLAKTQGLPFDFGAPSTLLVFIGLSYGLGHGSWLLLEKPIQRLARNSRLGQALCRR